MPASPPASGLGLTSLISSAGRLVVSLEDEAVRAPGEAEVLVRVQAAPINPSDLGVLFGAADMSTIQPIEGRSAIGAEVPPARMRPMAGRLDQPLATGIEGAGTVVAAGGSPAAQALLGRVVHFQGAAYSQYRTVAAAEALVMPAGVTPAQAASAYVNPMTALGMLVTMRREGHSALVNTAAASNLGQMLNRLCLADGVPLVCVVRRPDQAELLRGQGAAHVCVSADPGFDKALVEACAATGATLAFDAIGGGDLGGRILGAMETAIQRAAGGGYNRYGSAVHKQVYVYGGLDTGPTVFGRGFGMAWGMGGWVLTNFLRTLSDDDHQALRRRVAAEITTTFASRYSREVSLLEALRPEVLAVYNRRATGEKFLVNPALD